MLGYSLLWQCCVASKKLGVCIKIWLQIKKIIWYIYVYRQYTCTFIAAYITYVIVQFWISKKQKLLESEAHKELTWEEPESGPASALCFKLLMLNKRKQTEN